MKTQLELSLGRTLYLNTRGIRYQIDYWMNSNLLALFDYVKKDAFIGRYNERYHVLFVKTPRYFRGYRAKYFRFNVLDVSRKVVYKTDDILQLIDYLG